MNDTCQARLGPAKTRYKYLTSLSSDKAIWSGPSYKTTGSTCEDDPGSLALSILADGVNKQPVNSCCQCWPHGVQCTVTLWHCLLNKNEAMLNQPYLLCTVYK